MKTIRNKDLRRGVVLLAAFVLWTALIRHVDVRPDPIENKEYCFLKNICRSMEIVA